MKVRSIVAALLSTALVASAGIAVVLLSSAAAGDANTLYVNNTNFGYSAGSCVPGNDAYSSTDSTQNTCSLGAALTYANQNSSATTLMTVTLATGFAAAGGGTITPSAVTTNFMTTSVVNSLAYAGAYYTITAPMIVDLQNKLAVSTSGDARTTIYINEAGTSYDTGVQLLNASDIESGRSAIVVSGSSQYVTISGGTEIPTNYLTDEFLVIQNGAQHVTLSNYTIGNLYNGADENCTSAAVCFNQQGSTAASSDIHITNVTFTSTASSTNTACNATSNAGCVNNSIVLNAGAVVNGLEVANCQFTNLKKGIDTDLMVFSNVLYTNVTLSNLNFHDNTITNSGGCTVVGTVYCSLMLFYEIQGSQNNYIQHNTFVNTTSLNQPHAVDLDFDSNQAVGNGFYIQDNYFDGFTGAAIWAYTANITTVTRNQMGPNTYSNPNTTAEETGNQAGAMFAVTGTAQTINTWYPTAATMGLQNGTCQVQVALTQPTAANVPKTPVTIDLYWTAATDAEVYVGSQSGLTASPATITVPASLLNADGTMKSGYLRVQTQSTAGTQPQSSQYSRTIPTPTGSCAKGDFSLKLVAYSDSARTQEIPAGTPLAAGTTVYFTDVLTNLSATQPTVVDSVTDTMFGTGTVCQNVPLAPAQVDSTSCQWQAVIPGS